MFAFLFFIVGLLIGGGFGITFMCMLQINRQKRGADDK